MRVLARTSQFGWVEAGIPQIPIDKFETWLQSKGYSFVGFDSQGHREYHNPNPPPGWINTRDRTGQTPATNVSVGAKNRDKYLHPIQLKYFLRNYLPGVGQKQIRREIGLSR